MKIEVFDINHIINQIKCASPPSDKDMHKLINNLSILLEKNVARKNSPLEPTLAANTEKLNEILVDLCFLRKEIVQRFSREYFEILNEAVQRLKENRERVMMAEEPRAESLCWNLKTVAQPSEVMTTTFSKLQKARGIIEDALNKSTGSTKDPELMIESFFADF